MGIDRFVALYGDSDAETVASRRRAHADLARCYYHFSARLYEIGWGRSYHFCPFEAGDSFDAAMARQERFISDRAALGPGMTVLDAGCGVGGPMREIARHFGARIVGVNIIPEQVERARRYNEEAGLADRCEVVLGDFTDLPMGDDSFDAVLAIDSICHAPDRTQAYGDLFRVLRPGGLFATSDLVMTDRFNPYDPEHQRIKTGFAMCNGIPDVATAEECCASLVGAGFEFLEARDRGREGDPDTPWYSPLDARGVSGRALAASPVGRWAVQRALAAAQALFPSLRGTRQISRALNVGADAMVEGGRLGILTALFFMLGRKPARGRELQRGITPYGI